MKERRGRKFATLLLLPCLSHHLLILWRFVIRGEEAGRKVDRGEKKREGRKKDRRKQVWRRAAGWEWKALW